MPKNNLPTKILTTNNSDISDWKKSKKIYIAINLSDDKEVKTLNKKHRKKDYATDVLSFNINEKLEDGTLYLGDVVVNIEQAQRQASDYKNTLEEEISELAAHGILHLLGVHHEGDH